MLRILNDRVIIKTTILSKELRCTLQQETRYIGLNPLKSMFLCYNKLMKWKMCVTVT